MIFLLTTSIRSAVPAHVAKGARRPWSVSKPFDGLTGLSSNRGLTCPCSSHHRRYNYLLLRYLTPYAALCLLKNKNGDKSLSVFPRKPCCLNKDHAHPWLHLLDKPRTTLYFGNTYRRLH